MISGIYAILEFRDNVDLQQIWSDYIMINDKTLL